MPARRASGRPQDHLRRVGEVPAGQVGGRIGLVPDDVVEDPEPQALKGKPDGVDDVRRPGDPDRPVGLQHPPARLEPRKVERQALLDAAGLIPAALVDGAPRPGLAGDPAAGEEVGRVGKDHVEGLFGEMPVEDLDAIPLEEPQAAVGAFVVRGPCGPVDLNRRTGETRCLPRIAFRLFAPHLHPGLSRQKTC